MTTPRINADDVTLGDQVISLAARVAEIRTKHRFNEPTALKIVEMIFHNYWTGRQLDLQAAAQGMYPQPVEDQPIPDDQDTPVPDEIITGDQTIDNEETA